jgi:hypothetical protein
MDECLDYLRLHGLLAGVGTENVMIIITRIDYRTGVPNASIHFEPFNTPTRQPSNPHSQIDCSISVIYSLIWESIFRNSSWAVWISFSMFSFRSTICLWVSYPLLYRAKMQMR